MAPSDEASAPKRQTAEASEAIELIHSVLLEELQSATQQILRIGERHKSDRTKASSDVRLVVGISLRVNQLFAMYMQQMHDTSQHYVTFRDSLQDLVEDYNGLIDNRDHKLSDLQQALDRRTVKPRFADRDAEIVRLRDHERKSWGEIKRAINQNPKWRHNQSKQPLTVPAAKAAYKRAKSGHRPATN